MQKPCFFFGLTEVEVKEGQTIQIPILKAGVGSGQVWVCSSSGVGINGAGEADYIPVKQLLSFATNEDCKLINLTALSDYLTEPDEIFRLQLLAAEMGTIGSPNVLVVTIKDMPHRE
jgi:hypothetical protein